MDEAKGISKKLIDFIYYLKYEDLPSNVILQAKRCLLDYLGVVLGGSATETANKMRLFLSKFNDNPEVTVIGYHKKTDLFKAALVNGITSHVLELDDGHRYATVHAGAAIISALLPLIEKQKDINGKEAIVSLVAGYETALIIGRSIHPSHRERGFHATATCGTIGAAMAASKALRLTKKEMSNALGMAGSSASGLLQFLEDGSELKQFHPGKAALNGLLSAYLAQSGLTAPENILEGKRGFLKAETDKYDIPDVNNLGKRYAIMDVYFKPYAACRHCHAPIEAILNIYNKYNLKINEIEKIIISTYKSAVDGHSNPCPHSVVGAKMSVPFSIAVAMKTGWAGPKEFAPNFFDDPEILEITKKIEVKEDPSLSILVPERRPAIIEIFTKTGNKIVERVDFPKGEPENPISYNELKRKFRELASYSRSKVEMEKIIEIVEDVENKIRSIFQFIN